MLNVSIQPDKRSCCIPAVGFRLVSAQYTRILQQSHNVPDFSFACRRLFLAESPYHRFLNMAANLTGTIYEMKIRKEKISIDREKQFSDSNDVDLLRRRDSPPFCATFDF